MESLHINNANLRDVEVELLDSSIVAVAEGFEVLSVRATAFVAASVDGREA